MSIDNTKINQNSSDFRTGVSVRCIKNYRDRIKKIINGKRTIGNDTTIRLQRYFGIDAHFWLNLQSEYDLRIMKHKSWFDIKQRVIPVNLGA